MITHYGRFLVTLQLCCMFLLDAWGKTFHTSRNISKHQVNTLTRTNLSNPNGQPIHLENFTVFSRWDRSTIIVLDNERTTLHIQFDTIHRQQQNRATSCNMHRHLFYESKPKRSEICDLRLIEISIKDTFSTGTLLLFEIQQQPSSWVNQKCSTEYPGEMKPTESWLRSQSNEA